MRVLDLFAGPGGSHRGFTNVCEIEYYGIEWDRKVCDIHKVNNQDGILICDNAWDYLERDFLETFDFVWASPPCQTHSRAMLFWKNKSQWKEPDMRLYELIKLFKALRVKAVIENVIPWYKPLIEPTIKIDRHYFWSNFFIGKFEVAAAIKPHRYMYTKDYEERNGLMLPNRTIARNCLYPSIAEGIFRQVVEVG